MAILGLNKKLLLLFFLVIIALVVWVQIFSWESKKNLKVSFLDIGQGDSIFIQTKNGNQVLIDGGANKKVLGELSKQMSVFDRKIDMVIATHPDSDHIGGLVDVFSRFDVDFFVESGNKSETLVYGSLESVLGKKEINRILARRGMIFDLGDDIYLKILFPDRDVSALESNTASIILQVDYRETEFLLSGDAPSSIENYLASIEKENLMSDVLKLGHHGSKTSTSNFFLHSVSPRFAVVSAGAGNRYGHPHKDVIGTVRAFGANILSTAEDGTIEFFSDGLNLFLQK